MWAGFFIFFLAAMSFHCRAERYDNLFKRLDGIVDENYFSQWPSFLVTVACLVTAVSYIAMATGHGNYLQCCSGKSISVVRFVEWLMTGPLLLLAALHYALRLPHQPLRTTDSPFWESKQNNLVTLLIFLYLLMVTAGFVGSNICGGVKWAFLGFGVLCFLPLLHFLCRLNLDGNGCCVGFCRQTTPTAYFANRQLERRARYFGMLSNLVAFSWVLYPLVWAAVAAGGLSADGEAIGYLVLDFFTKVIFGYIASHSFLGPIDPPGPSDDTLLVQMPNPSDSRNGRYAMTNTKAPASDPSAQIYANEWQQQSGTGVITSLGSVWQLMKAPTDGTDIYYNTTVAEYPPTGGWFPSGGAGPPPSLNLITYTK